MKKWKWVEIILIVAVLSVHSYAAFSDAQNFPNRWFTRDDAYYYFKVAQNISEGHGITFDGINRANGYHPLWMAVCIPIFALARFDLVLPLRILLLVMAALSAATGIMLFRLISRALSKPVGVLAAAFWVFNTYIHAAVTQFGMETGITAFSLVLLLYLLEDFERKWRTETITLKQIAGLGLAAAFLLFSRLDTVFLLAIIGLWIVFRSTPIRYYLPLDILGIVAAVLASFTLRLGLHAYYEYASTALWMLALALVVKIPIYYFSGLYQRPGALPDKRLAMRITLIVTAASTLVAALMLGLNRIGLFGGFPRSTLFIEWGLSLLFTAATRLGFQHLAPQRAAKSPIAPVDLIKDNWQRWLSESAVYYGVWGGALGVYMLWSKIVFGVTSPVSGQIKRWWGSLPGNAYGGPARRVYTFFGVDTTPSDFNAWQLATAFVQSLQETFSQWLARLNANTAFGAVSVLVLLTCLLILASNRKRTIRASAQLSLLPLLVGAELQIIYYNSLGYSAAKEWYWVSQMIFVILLGSLLLDILLQAIRRRAPAARILIWAATALAVIYMAQDFTTSIIQRMPYGTEKAGQPYMDVLPLLEENTEPGSLIGMTGGGNVGYFIHGRAIVNMDGLINSNDYFLALRNGYADDYLEEIGLDYVFANPAILEGGPYRGQFTDRLGTAIAVYGKKGLMPFLPASAASR